jgi:ABC-2 type transport system ATP-binding protein
VKLGGILGAALACCLLFAPAAPAAASRDGYITSFDGTKIVYSFFPAPGLHTGQRAPTVMYGPGYASGRADSSDPLVAALLAAGYNVLTWDPRGFGDSGGDVEMDSPDYEGRDASALIDLIAKQPEAQLDRPGDPHLGMAGLSYGGGIQWVTAADDPRVDVITPQISWHSLVTSLDKNDSAKGGWGTILFGLGAEGSTVPGVTGGLTGQPAGFEFGRTQDPHATHGVADAIAAGQLAPENVDFFASRGPGALVNRIRVPTMIAQGTSDTLFTLDEAIQNYRALRANGVPVKMLWFCGSLTSASIDHGVCQTNPGSDPSITLHATIAWLDRYLKGDRSVSTGPRFEWIAQDGSRHGAADYPPPRGAPVVATGSGILPLAPGDTSGDPIRAAPASNAVNVPLPRVSGPVHLLGEPTLTLDYTGTAAMPDARIYAQLIDNRANQAVGPVVTPVKLALDGSAHTLTMPLEGIAIDDVPEASYSLQLTDGSNVYLPQRLAGVVNLSRIRVSVPTATAAASPHGSSRVAHRRSHTRHHRLRRR